MKLRQITRKYKLQEPVTIDNQTITHEIVRIHINNEIPPSHRNFQSYNA